MEEREINIIDLMVEILLHWRMFLVWMIGGAVLFGALSYLRSADAARYTEAEAEAMRNGEQEQWLTEEEMLNVRYAADYEKASLETETYQMNSPLMQIDSNRVCKAEATIAVVAENRQWSCDIARVYEDIVRSGELIERVAEDVGMETLGLSELLFLGRTIERTDLLRSSNEAVRISTVKDSEAATFKITALHKEEATCRAMLDSAVALLMEKQPNLQTALGAHQVRVANESFGVISDREIAKRQKEILNDVANMKSGMSDLIKGLSDKERKYYDFLADNTAGTEGETTPMESAAPGINLKYILLGAAMAVFAYAFLLFLAYIFSTKIRATDSMQELYGLEQLGMIPAEAGRKKLFGTVDQWILSIRNHNKRPFTPEKAMELAAVAAKMAVGKEAAQDVCLMGCGMKERTLDICQKIKIRLEEEGVRVNILRDVLYDAQALAELEGVKGVILVESAGSTLYDEIAAELELLKRQGIQLLGGIVVE